MPLLEKDACQTEQMRLTLESMLTVFVSQKGGTGKTTLSVTAAVSLYDRFAPKGASIGFVDCDPQVQSSGWIERAEPGITVSQAVTKRELELALNSLRTYDFVIADCPGGDADANVALLVAADLVLVPLHPSGLDFDSTTVDMLGLVRECRKQRRGKPRDVRLILNGLDMRTRASSEIIDESKKLKIPTARARVRRLTAFSDSYLDDTVVTRMPEAREAKRDAERLLLELFPTWRPRRSRTRATSSPRGARA